MDRIKNFFKRKIIKIIAISGVTLGGAFILIQTIQTVTTFLSIFMITQSDNCDDSGDGGALALGAYDKQADSIIRAVAKAVGKSLGINPVMVYAQLCVETGDQMSQEAKRDHNLGGVKYSPAISKYATPGGTVGDSSGGIYAHFNSYEDFAAVYRNTIRNMLKGTKPSNWRQFVHQMKMHGYFTAAESDYYNLGIGYYNRYKQGTSSQAPTVEKVAYLPNNNDALRKQAVKLADKSIENVHVQIPVKKNIIDEPGILKEAPLNYQDLTPLKHITRHMYEDWGSKAAVSDAANKAAGKDASQAYDSATHAVDDATKGINNVTGKHIFDTKGTKKAVKKADANLKDADAKWKKAHKKAAKEKKKVDEDGIDANDAACADGDDDMSVSGKWAYPFKGVTWDPSKNYEDGQQFGTSAGSSFRSNSFHDGFDFGSAKYHGNVYAVHDGKVKYVGYKYGFWIVWVVSGDGFNEVYQEAFGSRSDINVKTGEHVKVGQKIGRLTQSHLHLGISKKKLSDPCEHAYSNDGTWLDPIKVIKAGLKD